MLLGKIILKHSQVVLFLLLHLLVQFHLKRDKKFFIKAISKLFMSSKFPPKLKTRFEKFLLRTKDRKRIYKRQKLGKIFFSKAVTSTLDINFLSNELYWTFSNAATTITNFRDATFL